MLRARPPDGDSTESPTVEFLTLHASDDGVDFETPIPKLICGHTHEPRQNAVYPVDSGVSEPWEKADTGAVRST